MKDFILTLAIIVIIALYGMFAYDEGVKEGKKFKWEGAQAYIVQLEKKVEKLQNQNQKGEKPCTN